MFCGPCPGHNTSEYNTTPIGLSSNIYTLLNIMKCIIFCLFEKAVRSVPMHIISTDLESSGARGNLNGAAAQYSILADKLCFVAFCWEAGRIIKMDIVLFSLMWQRKIAIAPRPLESGCKEEHGSCRLCLSTLPTNNLCQRSARKRCNSIRKGGDSRQTWFEWRG